ncbi:MAG: hypothetical protein UX08_C0001G0044 [Candidatus Collierbacteria bacterium GW2011_GWB1_45_35]|uniref:Uncharacterized protein n=2 Tax=Candidatus Collieribacteriota TaxID=1752725 RepID=A0A0G1N107_9BACT|nr:MAG: hypothetical protein UW48_C0003G0041 [Microgenomates group bacterium GW2011_GWC1_44_23]KKT86732.1 MAG: hypothetical protein UW84_C0003G0014 [Candidatus Collierbacteria bacterium GW2011_GWA2_44_99]KKT95906.1 MAG: hypothetical protein UW96_C0003G0041 [Candidatus Collierbacteria bacterium GW2011_GWA1_45_15]KKU00990.1 MAG: hypothetical protein UX01_C0003G0043 [Candidatus Collierbacteria bacterium GW2011_GWB2_45_17]KKU05917.1 MAG: hypothetical protein UX08_C0001G0044 [Candidatus Collierbacte
MKRNKLYLFVALGLVILLTAIFFIVKGTQKEKPLLPKKQSPLTTRILINELPLADRPFTVLVPHATNRLFTFVTIGADKASSASLDLEYQSGDLLKGARASIDSPIASPFVKAIILGSCSTGGKCTFDTDLKSGTEKLKLTFPGQDVTHLLKGDFVFIAGQKNFPDGKVTFEPSKLTAKSNLIMMNSLGLPRPAEKEVLLYPIVISATDNKVVSGSMTIAQAGVTSAAIYDGTTYQPLKFSESGGVLKISLNHQPWSMNAEITRDDEKGTPEFLTLYLLGPIVLYK